MVWDFFKRDDSGTNAVCLKDNCKKTIPMKGGNTTGLISHLKKHSDEFKKFEKAKDTKDEEKKQKAAKKRKNLDEAEIASKQPKLIFFNQSGADKLAQDKLNDAIIEYVAKSGVSFRQAAQLKDVIHSVNKRIHVPSSKVLSRRMEVRAESTMQQVHNILASVKTNLVSVGFTTDLWTSRAQDAYMSLTCSFIDKNWRLHRYTPFVKHFPGSHTGERIALELDEMIDELGLSSPNITKYSVNDNASNQKKAIRESVYLTEYNCDLHTLQLQINDTFKDVDGMKHVLSKSKLIAKFTNQSPQAMEQLKKECKKRKIAFKKPKNSQETRWNSAYTCMESILYLKPVLKDLMEVDDKWLEFSLNFREWKLLEGAVKLLKPFLVATKTLEAESTPTINLVIEEIFGLKTGLESFIAKPQNCQYGVTFARSLLKNLEKRFPSCGAQRFERSAANYLDPCLKGVHLGKLNLLESTKDALDVQYSVPDDVEEQETGEEVNLELSPTSRLLKQARLKKNDHSTSKLKSEMDKYESYSFAPRKSNILYWWKINESMFPRLAKIARTILAIPSSSAKSERVFSTGGNIVTAKRCRLGPRRVEQLIVIRENLARIKEFEILSGRDIEVQPLEKNPFAMIRAHMTDIDGVDMEPEPEVVTDEEDDFLDDDDDQEESFYDD